MRQAARQGVTRRTLVVGALGRARPARRGVRHPPRGRRATRAPRADPHTGAGRGRARGAHRRDAGARRAGGDRAGCPRGRPRDDPPAPAHRAAHHVAAPQVPAALLDAPPTRHRTGVTATDVGAPSPARLAHGIRARHARRGRGRVGGTRRRVRRGRRPTCSPPSRRCTPSAMPPRPCCPAGRRRCRPTRWRGRGRGAGGIHVRGRLPVRGGQRPLGRRPAHPLGRDPRRAAAAACRPGGRRQLAGGHDRPPAALPRRDERGCRPPGSRGAPHPARGVRRAPRRARGIRERGRAGGGDPVARDGRGAGPPLGLELEPFPALE